MQVEFEDAQLDGSTVGELRKQLQARMGRQLSGIRLDGGPLLVDDGAKLRAAGLTRVSDIEVVYAPATTDVR